MQADKQILNRLATIEGHLKGIRKMVEEDQYCVDIIWPRYLASSNNMVGE
jgi:DNA-binding FrmR family transcriptional regulator